MKEQVRCLGCKIQMDKELRKLIPSSQMKTPRRKKKEIRDFDRRVAILKELEGDPQGNENIEKKVELPQLC